MKIIFTILFFAIISLNGNAQSGKQRDSMINLLHTATSDSSRMKIYNGLERFYRERNMDSGFYYIDKFIAIAQKNNLAIDLAAGWDEKGYLFMKQSKLAESLQYILMSMKEVADLNDGSKSWVYKVKDPTIKRFKLSLSAANALHIGHLMGRANNFEQQLNYYFQVLNYARQLGDTSSLGSLYGNMGRAYLFCDKLDSALLMEQKAIKALQRSGDETYLSSATFTLGEIYLKKGNDESGLKYIYEAMALANVGNNYVIIANGYTTLSDYYFSHKNKDSSLFYARKSQELLKLTDSKKFAEVYTNLYKSFELNNNRDSIFKYQSLALVANDSVYKAKIKSLSDFQNITYKEQQRLQQLENERTESRNRLRIYAMFTGLGVLLIVGLILYRNNRQKQKANKILNDTLQDLTSTQSQLIQSEKMASLGELTAGIAHEIQNPLNFVNNFSEINKELLAEMNDEIEKKNFDEVKLLAKDITDNEEKINHHGRRADAIVKGMLQHSRNSDGKKEPTDINALCDEYLRLSYHGLRAKDKSFNATIKTEFDPALGKINIVPQDVGRVIMNLLTNAFYVVNEKALSAQPLSSPTLSAATVPTAVEKITTVKYEPIVTVKTSAIPLGSGGVPGT